MGQKQVYFGWLDKDSAADLSRQEAVLVGASSIGACSQRPPHSHGHTLIQYA